MKDLTVSQKAVFAVATGIVSNAGSAIIGYYTMKLLTRLETKGKKPAFDTVEEYNDAVAKYNGAVIYFNQATEGAMENIPKLKALIDQVDRDAYNAAFEEIMREEF
jgi:hypothetical protein